MKRSVLILVVVLAGCGGQQTDAERGIVPGDVTSCAAVRSPVGCGPAITCTQPIEPCAALGCAIVPSGLVLYADHSYADVSKTGTWATSFSQGFEMLSLDGAPPVEVDVTPGVAYSTACP